MFVICLCTSFHVHGLQLVLVITVSHKLQKFSHGRHLFILCSTQQLTLRELYIFHRYATVHHFKTLKCGAYVIPGSLVSAHAV